MRRASFSLLWLIWALIFMVLEGVALFDGNPSTLPLTEETVRRLPGEAVMAFIGWLMLHFYLRYRKKGDL